MWDVDGSAGRTEGGTETEVALAPTTGLGLSRESPRVAASSADYANGSSTLDIQLTLFHFGNEST